MAGENGGDCRLLALTALLHAAHEGATTSRARYTSECVFVCVKKRKAERGKKDAQYIQMVRQAKGKHSQREEGN